jgi:hypothetical protein
LRRRIERHAQEIDDLKLRILRTSAIPTQSDSEGKLL